MTCHFSAVPKNVEMIFAEYYKKLMDTVNPDDITAGLFTEHLISDKEKEEITHQMYVSTVRMDKLFSAVKRAITVKNENIYIFLNVLEMSAEKYNELVVKMRASLEGRHTSYDTSVVFSQQLLNTRNSHSHDQSFC